MACGKPLEFHFDWSLQKGSSSALGFTPVEKVLVPNSEETVVLSESEGDRGIKDDRLRKGKVMSF